MKLFNVHEFKEEFATSELYATITSVYPPAEYDYCWDTMHNHTPRYNFLNPARKVVFMKSFFYLRYLLLKNPTDIYDIGCGDHGFFKSVMPNIIGISPDEHDLPDIIDFYDSNYAKTHLECFDSVYSINALHFIPITNFKKLVIDFMSMVKPAGSGYLAVNTARLIDNELNDTLVNTFGTTSPKHTDTVNYINKVIDSIGTELFVMRSVDMNVDEYISGNVHLVFDKD